MKVIEPSFEIVDDIDGMTILRRIEAAARTCYKSEQNTTEESAKLIARNLINRGHESALEHEKVTVRIICDRGVSHEIVRHRIASYSQESTRYCNYRDGRFGGELTFIKPCFWPEYSNEYSIWKRAMERAEIYYYELMEIRKSAQEARAVLPNSLKTEIIVTMNIREWRHFFFLRTAKDAHPQMREIACPMLRKFRELIPVVFDDVGTVEI